MTDEKYDGYACRPFVVALIARAMHDARLSYHRQDALRWIEGGECRHWCELAGIDVALVFAQAERVLDKPVLKVGYCYPRGRRRR